MNRQKAVNTQFKIKDFNRLPQTERRFRPFWETLCLWRTRTVAHVNRVTLSKRLLHVAASILKKGHDDMILFRNFNSVSHILQEQWQNSQAKTDRPAKGQIQYVDEI